MLLFSTKTILYFFPPLELYSWFFYIYFYIFIIIREKITIIMYKAITRTFTWRQHISIAFLPSFIKKFVFYYTLNI